MNEHMSVPGIMITVVTLFAIAAAAIVALRARWGADSPKFQLSRIGILWATASILIMTCSSMLPEIVAWSKENPWISGVLLWGITALALVVFVLPRSFVLPGILAVATLHTWASYIICNHPAWPIIKAVVFSYCVLMRTLDNGIEVWEIKHKKPTKPSCVRVLLFKILGKDPSESLCSVADDCIENIAAVAAPVEGQLAQIAVKATDQGA